MRRPFRIKTVLLLFMAAFIIFPFCVLLTYFCIDTEKRISQSAIENSSTYVRQIANNINQVSKISNYLTSSLMMDAKVLTSLRALQDDHDSYEQYKLRSSLSETLATVEATIMNAADGKLLFMTSTGHIISSSNRISPDDFEGRAQWLAEAYQSNRSTVFDIRLEKLFSRVQLGAALHPNGHLYFRRSIISYSGQFLGMIAVQLAADGMWGREPKSNSANMTGSNLMVLDRQGEIHIAKHENNGELEQLRTLPELQSLKTGEISSGRLGQLYYNALALDGDQLVLFLVQPSSEMFAIGNAILKNMIYLACILIVFSVISMILISHAINKPISALVQNLEEQSFDTLYVELPRRRFLEMENLVTSYNLAGKRIGELIQQVRTESFLREKANYETLISQISPHFIFNTVNAIKYTAQAAEDEKSVEALTALGDILHSVYGRRTDVVSVGMEMQLLRSYVKIMRLRFDQNFQYVDAVPTEMYHYEIPAFSLQPIVENAVLHGVRSMTSGQIVVSVVESDQDLTFFVFNNGQTPDPEMINRQLSDEPRDKHKITGIGLHNIHMRIRLLYGADYGLSLNKNVTVGCEIRLLIPRKEAVQIDD